MRRTILVVEDEADLVGACVRLLRRRGWRVETADTRQAAMVALARGPALVIIDRRLPDGDGLDVLRVAAAAGTPAIMISGHDWRGTRRLAIDHGAAAFLGKPFSTRDLLALVDDILGDPPPESPPLPPPPPSAPGPTRFGLGA